MRAILLTLSFIMLAVLSHAQSTLSGKIIDNQTSEPLPGASVAIPGSNIATITDDRGEFVLHASEPIYTVAISFIGYETKHLNIDPQTKYLTIVLHSTNLTLSEITVIGFDNNRKLIETAGAIALLNSREIQRSTNVSLGQALNIVPGVRMEENGFGGSARLSIRGSLLRSPWGIRNIKIYWNDIPLTDPAGTSSRFNALDVTTIGSLEIIKGPSGSIYGAGTGGVINIISNRADFGERSIEVSNSVGSYGLWRRLATIKTGGDKSNILLSYVDQDLSGFREQQSVNKRALNLSATFSPGEVRTISINAFHYNGNFDLPGALTQHEFDQNPRQALLFNKDNDTRVSNTSTGLALSQRYQFSETLENITSASVIFNSLDHPWGSSAFYNGYSIGTSQGISTRSRFIYSPVFGSVRARITAGMEFQTSFELEKEYANILGYTGSLQGDYEFSATQSIWFAQAEFDLPASFIATAGGSYNTTQYDYINRISTDPQSKISFTPTFAPRVGLVKKLSTRTAVHGSISYGFSPPTQNEVLTQAGINPILSAEYGINYETGFRGSVLDERLNLDITAYRFDLTDAILPRYNEAQQAYFENEGKTKQNGIETFVSYLVMSNSTRAVSLLKLWSSYTFNHYRFKEYRKESFQQGQIVSATHTGNRVTGIPDHILNVGVDMETRLGVYMMATLNYTSKIPLNDGNTAFAKPYTLLGGKVGYRCPMGKHLKLDLYAGIDNAFDTRYNNFLALNAFGDRYYNPGAGVNYFASASFKYAFQ